MLLGWMDQILIVTWVISWGSWHSKKSIIYRRLFHNVNLTQWWTWKMYFQFGHYINLSLKHNALPWGIGVFIKTCGNNFFWPLEGSRNKMWTKPWLAGELTANTLASRANTGQSLKLAEAPTSDGSANIFLPESLQFKPGLSNCKMGNYPWGSKCHCFFSFFFLFYDLTEWGNASQCGLKNKKNEKCILYVFNMRDHQIMT